MEEVWRNAVVCECPEATSGLRVDEAVETRRASGEGVAFGWSPHPGGLWAHCLQASAM